MKEFKLPDPGEGLVEAEIVAWRVAEGDTVAVNDIVLEIETSKSIVELPIPWAGTVAKILVEEGATVAIGTPVIVIDDGDEQGSDESATSMADEKPEPLLVGYGEKPSTPRRRRGRHRDTEGDAGGSAGQALADSFGQGEASRRPDDIRAPHPVVAEPSGDPLPGPGRPRTSSELVWLGSKAPSRAKPPVRKLARMLGVDLDEIEGTGPHQTITRADVEGAAALAALRARSAQGARPSPGQAGPAEGRVTGPGTEPHLGARGFEASGASSPGFGGDYVTDPPYDRRQPTGERRTPIKGVRKVTAQAMVDSVSTHVHVTEWVTLDVTATMAMVERLRARREFAHLRVSPLLVYAKAVCLAMGNNPDINSSWDEEAQEIVHHGQVNLGIAAATPRGLMVPNIKNAQAMSTLQLCEAINSLVQVSKEGRLQPADYHGGTFTITNVGVFGIDSGTPIINGNESAILCMGSIDRRPWVVGEGTDERIEPRWVTTISMSFDHRLIDGEQGSRFLREVADLLSDPTLAMLY